MVPSFLGMGISLSLECFHSFAVSNLSAKANRCLKLRDLTPSIPAVFLPVFSCDTCRTASSLAAKDFRISFCKFLVQLGESNPPYFYRNFRD